MSPKSAKVGELMVTCSQHTDSKHIVTSVKVMIIKEQASSCL